MNAWETYKLYAKINIISEFYINSIELGKVDFLYQKIRIQASLHESHLYLLGAQNIMIDFLDFLLENDLGLSHTDVG